MRDSSRRTILIISVAVIVLLLVILGTAFLGIRQIGNIFLWILGGLIFLSIFGIVVYVVYYLFFKKHKFDATYMNKKSLIQAGRVSKPSNINDLYLSGDAGHSRVRIGKIIGYCRIQTIRKVTDYDPKTGMPVIVRDKTNPNIAHERFTIEKEEQDVFVVETAGFPMKFFSDPIVVRVKPDEHDDLVGDVTLNGFSLIPISEYFYLNKDYIDVQNIDQSILMEGKRTIAFEMLKDFKEVTDKAMALDSGHKKELEKKQLYEIPNMNQQQVQR